MFHFPLWIIWSSIFLTGLPRDFSFSWFQQILSLGTSIHHLNMLRSFPLNNDPGASWAVEDLLQLGLFCRMAVPPKRNLPISYTHGYWVQRKGWILETGRLVGEVLDFMWRFFLNPSHLALYTVFSNAASSGWLSSDLQLSFSATCLPSWAYTSTLLSFCKRNWVLFWTYKIMLPPGVRCLLAAVILPTLLWPGITAQHCCQQPREWHFRDLCTGKEGSGKELWYKQSCWSY